MNRLQPVVDDHDTGGFFAAAARGELVVQECANCHTVLHVPRAYCRACGAWSPAWRPAGTTGTLHSFTVADHQVHPAYPVPYTIVLVDLDDVPGVRLLGHLDGNPDLTIGMPMRVRFDELAEGVVLPNWEPAPAGA